MRAISIKCPECAARISAAPGSETATCSYCGTTAYIQRRSRFLEIPRPPPPRPPAGQPALKVATQRHSSGWRAGVALLLLGVGVPVAGVALKRAGTELPGAGSRTGASSPREPSWDGVDAVMLADLTGDGIADPLGRMRVLQPADRVHWAAFDGATGKRLWLSPFLGDRGDLIHTPSGLAHGAVVVGLGPGELAGLSATDGSVTWRIRLSEKVKSICAGDRGGTVVVETADEKMSRIRTSDGGVEGVIEAGDCQPLPNDGRSADGPRRSKVSWGGRGRHRMPDDLEGITAREALFDPESDVAIALGTRSHGTRVPMVARYLPGSGELLWSTLVPASDPLSVTERAPEDNLVAVDGEAVAVVYNVEFAHGYRLTCFAASDGRRMWDIELPGDSPMSAVRLSPSHVFVSRWSGLHAFDRATGKPAYTID
jgi:outer membrane protein assembly factor BamB